MFCASRTLLCAAALGVGFVSSAHAATIALWGFQTVIPADVNNSATNGPHNPDVGAGSASGVHVSTGTDWSTPVGNGSTESYSSNEWAAGDYYQFQVNTSGQTNVVLTFDHVSSNTGPRDFKVQWSTDGSVFSDLASYSVLANASPNTWGSGTYLPQHTYGPFSDPMGGFDNQASLYVRLTQVGTVAANGGTVATTGTSRIDNVHFEAVPEPASLGLLAFAAVGMVGRRRAR